MLSRLIDGLMMGCLAINTMVAQVDPETNLIAHMVQAEAGGQCEEGLKLVIDTVLNRVDSEYFPDTVTDVILAPGQFAVVENGAIQKAQPTDEIYDLIRQELTERTNYDVIYFTAGGYNPSGEPWAQVGDHYFSTIRKELQK